MNVCIKCGSNFKSTVIIDGKRRNLHGRKCCLDCLEYRKRPERYNKEILEKIVSSSFSIQEVMRKLGFRCLTGGSHGHLSKKIKSYNIDISHFLGRRANSGKEHKGGPKKKNFRQILIRIKNGNPRAKIHQLRRALLEIGVKQICTECKCGEIWNDKKIVLEIDHMDGDPLNNQKENLRFLCPNCHSQTRNYAKKA